MLNEEKITELKEGDLLYFKIRKSPYSEYIDKDECYVFIEYITPTTIRLFSQASKDYVTWDITSLYKALGQEKSYLEIYQDGEEISKYLFSELKRQKVLWGQKVKELRFNPFSLSD